MSVTAKTKIETRLVRDMRTAIAKSGLSSYALGKLAGVDPAMVDRFKSGERSLRLDTAGKLAGVLNLQLRAGD